MTNYQAQCWLLSMQSEYLRGDFLEHLAISAQKYRHPLRENGAFYLN